MSLVSTLGKIAIGLAVAKGASKMLGGKRGSAGGAGGGLGDLGGLLGGALGGAGGASSSGGGGLGDLGALLGGRGGASGGGLGGLLESLSGAGAGSAGSTSSAPPSGSLGDLLNSALQGKTVQAPPPSAEEQAKFLLKAMISAAKCDGTIDQEEQRKLVEHLGNDVSDAEREFVLAEMRAPLDLDGLIRDTPKGLEQQAYAMSVMGINLDSRAEAEYLDKLRQGYGISEQTSNAVHQQLGVPVLYG